MDIQPLALHSHSPALTQPFALLGRRLVLAGEDTLATAPTICTRCIHWVAHDCEFDSPGTADKAGVDEVEVVTIVEVTSRSSDDGKGEDGHSGEEDSGELDLDHGGIVWG